MSISSINQYMRPLRGQPEYFSINGAPQGYLFKEIWNLMSQQDKIYRPLQASTTKVKQPKRQPNRFRWIHVFPESIIKP